MALFPSYGSDIHKYIDPIHHVSRVTQKLHISTFFSGTENEMILLLLKPEFFGILLYISYQFLLM